MKRKINFSANPCALWRNIVAMSTIWKIYGKRRQSNRRKRRRTPTNRSCQADRVLRRRVYDEREMVNMVDAVLEFWLTAGRHARRVRAAAGQVHRRARVIPVNSGSSANLVAMTTLCSPQLKQRLLPGDEVITPAVTFPTTLAPIVQNRLIPVLVDAEMGTYNIDLEQLEAAMSPRTRALFITHTLGNPIAMDRVVEFARARNLFIVEDTCDALGSKYNGQSVGTFGHLATVVLPGPSHHHGRGRGGVRTVAGWRIIRRARLGTRLFCGYDNPVNGSATSDSGADSRHCYYDHRYYLDRLQPEATDAGGDGRGADGQTARLVAARSGTARRRAEEVEEFLILPTWLPNADLVVCPAAHRARYRPLTTALTRAENHKQNAYFCNIPNRL